MARTELVGEDKADFERLEGVIQKGLETFVEVGEALKEIRDRDLYLPIASTFESYVQIRWKMSRARAYQQIAAAETVGLLSTMVDTGPLPDSERTARPLANSKLPAEQRAQAWTEAVEESGGKPTAKDVQRAVDKRRDLPKVPRPPKHEAPEDAAAAIVAGAQPNEPPPTARDVQRHFRKPVDGRVRALLVAAHDMSALDDEDVAALETNDLMVDGLKKAVAQITRIIESHNAGAKRESA